MSAKSPVTLINRFWNAAGLAASSGNVTELNGSGYLNLSKDDEIDLRFTSDTDADTVTPTQVNVNIERIRVGY